MEFGLYEVLRIYLNSSKWRLAMSSSSSLTILCRLNMIIYKKYNDNAYSLVLFFVCFCFIFVKSAYIFFWSYTHTHMHTTIYTVYSLHRSKPWGQFPSPLVSAFLPTHYLLHNHCQGMCDLFPFSDDESKRLFSVHWNTCLKHIPSCNAH